MLSGPRPETSMRARPNTGLIMSSDGDGRVLSRGQYDQPLIMSSRAVVPLPPLTE